LGPGASILSDGAARPFPSFRSAPFSTGRWAGLVAAVLGRFGRAWRGSGRALTPRAPVGRGGSPFPRVCSPPSGGVPPFSRPGPEGWRLGPGGCPEFRRAWGLSLRGAYPPLGRRGSLLSGAYPPTKRARCPVSRGPPFLGRGTLSLGALPHVPPAGVPLRRPEDTLPWGSHRALLGPQLPQKSAPPRRPFPKSQNDQVPQPYGTWSFSDLTSDLFVWACGHTRLRAEPRPDACRWVYKWEWIDERHKMGTPKY